MGDDEEVSRLKQESHLPQDDNASVLWVYYFFIIIIVPLHSGNFTNTRILVRAHNLMEFGKLIFTPHLFMNFFSHIIFFGVEVMKQS